VQQVEESQGAAVEEEREAEASAGEVSSEMNTLITSYSSHQTGKEKMHHRNDCQNKKGDFSHHDYIPFCFCQTRVIDL